MLFTETLPRSFQIQRQVITFQEKLHIPLIISVRRKCLSLYSGTESTLLKIHSSTTIRHRRRHDCGQPTVVFPPTDDGIPCPLRRPLLSTTLSLRRRTPGLGRATWGMFSRCRSISNGYRWPGCWTKGEEPWNPAPARLRLRREFMDSPQYMFSGES